MNWPASELRLTDHQAEFLRYGHVKHWSQGFAMRTEVSLAGRKMLGWVKIGNAFHLRANHKGKAALALFQQRQAANDNRPQETTRGCS